MLMERTRAVAVRHPKVVAEVRGRGLMIGIKCVVPSAALNDALRKRHVLAVTAADNVVRFLPPLIIDPSHVDEVMAALEDSCRELTA
jgi:acetylornithine/N-succinyldiaminopimelate aminotransferase